MRKHETTKIQLFPLDVQLDLNIMLFPSCDRIFRFSLKITWQSCAKNNQSLPNLYFANAC